MIPFRKIFVRDRGIDRADRVVLADELEDRFDAVAAVAVDEEVGEATEGVADAD